MKSLFAIALLLSLVVAQTSVSARADATDEKIIQLYKRIAGKVPNDQEFNAAKAMFLQGKNVSQVAMDTVLKHPGFYETYLRGFVATMLDVDDFYYTSKRGRANQELAIVTHVVENDLPFTDILTEKKHYFLNRSYANDLQAEAGGQPSNNVRYDRYMYRDYYWELMYSQGLQLMSHLVPEAPLGWDDPNGTAAVLPSSELAGTMTAPYTIMMGGTAGTNRRFIPHLLKAYTCTDINSVRDSSFATNAVNIAAAWRDIPRDHANFNTCISCHGFMDSMAQAYAYYSSGNGQPLNALVAQYPSVQGKMLQNDQHTGGYVVTNSSWTNHLMTGANGQFFDWGPNSASGNNVSDLGRAISQSGAFSKCMVERFLEKTCKIKPDASHTALIKRLTKDFKGRLNHNARALIAEITGIRGCL